MQTKLIQQTAAGFTGLLHAFAAHAARPLITDDTGLLDLGSCGLEAVPRVTEPSQGNRHTAASVKLLHTRRPGRQFTLHANQVPVRDALARRGSTTWALALEPAGWGPLALMGEPIVDGPTAPAWNIGLRWPAVPDRWSPDTACGQQMGGGRPEALPLGLKLSFST